MSDAVVAVGLDLGTSGLKGVALRADGSLAARAGACYPTARPCAGCAEQAPQDWIAALRTVVTKLAAAVPARCWSAVGLSGMIPTLVPLGPTGKPLGAAITWEDGRAEDQAGRLRHAVGGQELYERTGQRVDGRYLLPFAMWLRELEPSGRGRLTRLAGAKDWLHWWLTRRLVTDPSTGAGYGCLNLHRACWDSEILAAAFAGPAPALPDLQPPATVTGLSREAATRLGLRAGLPICLGAADSVLAARAVGVSEPGATAYIAGTSTVILAVSRHPALDSQRRYLITPMDRDQRFGLEADLVSTGSTVRWLAHALGLGDGAEDQVWALAEGSAPGAHGLVFLPYLGPGEQGTLWDPGLRGAITGLTLAHTRADLARALLEGIVLESRRCLHVLAEAGAGDGEIVVTGGPARAAVFRQALATATGRPVRAAPDAAGSAAAAGAAALAFQATGAPAPPPPAPGSVTSPDLTAKNAWDALWERHEHTRMAAGTPRTGPPGWEAAARHLPRPPG